ncbi:MAG TPA: zinc-dependent metalloprotease, partial [Acidimicrobiia bacterium]|nr:zinc-dependent metalloprotease [Acidimicrobiia bacterium]
MTSSRSGSGRLAGRIAGTYPLAETYHRSALEADMTRLTGQVSDLVPAATGLDLPGDPTTIVIGREEWIERNVASFSHLMKPLQRQLTEKMEAAGPRGRSVATFTNRLVQA